MSNDDSSIPQDGSSTVYSATTEARSKKHRDDPSRRQFLGRVGGATAAVMAAGVVGLEPLIGSKGSEALAVELSPFVDRPQKRAKDARKIRKDAAEAEKNLGQPSHRTNGDEELYPNRIGNFHKTLPHNSIGEVDPAAYLRDVPFTDYDSNPVVQQACDDLTRFGNDYKGPKVSGVVTPQVLFRYDFPGTTVGPMVSQILYQLFFYDGIEVIPLMRTRQPVINWNPDGTFTYDPAGRDFLTAFNEWLNAQNGVPLGNTDVFDATRRFIRSVRDVGHLAGSDAIQSAYYRASLVLRGLEAEVDDGNPYKNSNRQGGFATFGAGHLNNLIGAVHKGERHTWYHKWFVHRYPRPDGFGGLVDNCFQGRANYPLHADLLNSPVFPLIAAYNEHLNQVRFGSNETSYLLPMELPGGSPNHPSAPAGHAVVAGACVTILKAWFKEDTVIDPALLVQPNRDGTALVPYSGPPLTIGGELNKLAHNMSAGRDMSGVHWRVADDLTGLFQGEAVAIRLLNEAKATYPEPNATFSLTKFDGTTITI